MRNVTVCITDDGYRRARVWAAQRDTTLSAVVTRLLETMPGMARANAFYPIGNQTTSQSQRSAPVQTTPAGPQPS